MEKQRARKDVLRSTGKAAVRVVYSAAASSHEWAALGLRIRRSKVELAVGRETTGKTKVRDEEGLPALQSEIPRAADVGGLKWDVGRRAHAMVERLVASVGRADRAVAAIDTASADGAADLRGVAMRLRRTQ